MSARRRLADWIGRLGVLRPACTFALIAFALAFVSLAARPAGAAGLIGARTGGIAVTVGHLVERAEAADLVLTLSQPVEPTAFTLSGPDRIILDLPQVAFKLDPGAIDPAKREPAGTRHGHRPGKPFGLVASVRFGLLAPGRSRVVVGLAEPARIVAAAVERDGSGAPVLTLRLARTDRASFDAAARAPQPITSHAPASSPVGVAASPMKPAARPVVVIDPGHGGPDNGAERNGVVEKDLTLAFARALAARLEAGGRYSVVMTRSSDVFIPLSERVAIARRAGAALMISVHADALPEASRDAADISGATVYTVSDRASDAYAATVAAKENAADASAGVAGQADTADVNDILFDLTRQETRAFSHVFARTLVNYWSVVGRLNKNPQRAAGFVVLKAPDVPSVLVELGYLSSSTDAASFQSGEWRDKASGRMAEAVDAYFAGQHAPGPTPRQLSAGLAEPQSAGWR